MNKKTVERLNAEREAQGEAGGAPPDLSPDYKNARESAAFPAYRLERTARLMPYANNARTHTPAQITKIAASIREFGFTNPVLIDGKRGIIAGHGRVLAAKQLGMGDVPVIELSHLSDAQRRAYVIADNRLALDAGWDDELLALELGDLRDEGFDLALTGFDGHELDGLLGVEKQSPDGFATYDEDIATDHKCPKCGYVFSGGAKVPKTDE